MNTIPGWKLVPEVATNEMLVAMGAKYEEWRDMREAYAVMLSAAPVPPEHQAPSLGLVEAVRLFLQDASDKSPGDMCVGDWSRHLSKLELSLHDQQQPAPAEQKRDERAAFEEWHRSKFAKNGLTGDPTRDMHNGVRDENYGPAEQQNRWECWQTAVRYARAALDKPAPDAAALVEAVRAYQGAQDALDNREYVGINAEPYEVLMRRKHAARRYFEDALRAFDQQTGGV